MCHLRLSSCFPCGYWDGVALQLVGGRDLYGLAALRLRLGRVENPHQGQGQGDGYADQDGYLKGVEKSFEH